jgi:sRNA-binding carbon storage regulator CsrA
VPGVGRIWVTLTDVMGRGAVRLGFEAPPEVIITREELLPAAPAGGAKP